MYYYKANNYTSFNIMLQSPVVLWNVKPDYKSILFEMHAIPPKQTILKPNIEEKIK